MGQHCTLCNVGQARSRQDFIDLLPCLDFLAKKNEDSGIPARKILLRQGVYKIFS